MSTSSWRSDAPTIHVDTDHAELLVRQKVGSLMYIVPLASGLNFCNSEEYTHVLVDRGEDEKAGPHTLL